MEKKGTTITVMEEGEHLGDFVERAIENWRNNGGGKEESFAKRYGRSLASIGPFIFNAKEINADWVAKFSKYQGELMKKYGIKELPFSIDKREVILEEPDFGESIPDHHLQIIENARNDSSKHYILGSDTWGFFDVDQLVDLEPEKIESFLKESCEVRQKIWREEHSRDDSDFKDLVYKLREGQIRAAMSEIEAIITRNNPDIGKGVNPNPGGDNR